MNRQAFQQIAADFLDDELLQSAAILRWKPIFKALAQEAAHQRIVLVIDEFQYIGKNNPAFLSVFQRIWDTLLSQSNIMVILCGSLVSMMMSQTLRYDSPLYGRRYVKVSLSGSASKIATVWQEIALRTLISFKSPWRRAKALSSAIG